MFDLCNKQAYQVVGNQKLLVALLEMNMVIILMASPICWPI